MLLRFIAALAEAVPAFGVWLAGVIDGDDKQPEFTRSVREILPAKSASRAVAEELERG